jgi:hypothetical protein
MRVPGQWEASSFEVDVGQNGRPMWDHRFKHVYVYMVSIDRPIIGVPNFDPYPSQL